MGQLGNQIEVCTAILSFIWARGLLESRRVLKGMTKSRRRVDSALVGRKDEWAVEVVPRIFSHMTKPAF
jgi:hypothetical protein